LSVEPCTLSHAPNTLIPGARALLTPPSWLLDDDLRVVRVEGLEVRARAHVRGEPVRRRLVWGLGFKA